jgi:hypothetical protein
VSIKNKEKQMAEIRHFPGSTGQLMRENVVPKYAPEVIPAGKRERFCVYNLVRKRFVATNVEAVDGSDASLEGELRDFRPSGERLLWVAPFREIPSTSVRFPVDLVILDNDCAVLDTVESFPLMGSVAWCPEAASLLVMPADSLAREEIRVGDQMAIAVPEEMKRYLQRLQRAEGTQNEVGRPVLQQNARTAAEQPVETGSGETGKEENAKGALPGVETMEPGVPGDLPPAEASPTKIGRTWKKDTPKNWFVRLLVGDTPDPRSVQRHSVPGLVAFFFTGGAPKEHRVRDISRSGLYIVTSERWYQGTLVRITLTDRHKPTVERSITVNSKVVRLGADGVGLEFILAGDGRRHGKAFELSDQSIGVDAAQICEFLEKLKEK